MKNKSIRKIVNVDKTNYVSLYDFKQEDDAVLLLSLFKNSTEFDITGQTVKLSIKRPDNTLIKLEATEGEANPFLIIENNLDITLKNNVFVVPGLLECDLEILDDSGKMTTASFYITVNTKVIGETTLKAVNEIAILDQVKIDEGIRIKNESGRVENENIRKSEFGEVKNVYINATEILGTLSDKNIEANVSIEDLNNLNLTSTEILENLSSKNVEANVSLDELNNLNIVANTTKQGLDNWVEGHKDIVGLDNRVKQTSEQLAEIDQQKANRGDLETVNGRINNLIINPGNGTTPPELTDIRVGVDGKTYASAGDSIRNQINNLIGVEKLQWVDGYNITTGKTLNTEINLTPVLSSSWSYIIKNCVEGDTFVINGVGGLEPRLWAFIDSNNVLLSVANRDINAEHGNLQIIAPKNATKLILNSFSWQHTDSSYKIKSTSAIYNRIAQVNSDFSISKSNIKDLVALLDTSFITFTDRYYINTNFAVGSTISITPSVQLGFSYAIVDCSEGEGFIINGKGGLNPRLWAFIDSNNVLLSVADRDTNAENKNLVITAPKNATKLILNSFNTAIGTCIKRGIVNKIDTINKTILKDEYLTGTKNIEFIDGYNIDIGTLLGFGVNLTPKVATGWSYAIMDCHAGSRFILSGYGTGNARMYGFINANNKLLDYAISSTYKNEYVIAPENTTKIIINSLTNQLSNGENKYSLSTSYGNTEALEYKNRLDIPSTDLTLADYVNGLKFSKELQTPIGDFAKAGDYFMHVPTHKIINDIVYVTYYVNTRSGNEKPSEMTARFAYAPLNDINNKIYIDLQDVGDTYEGKTVTAIYDTILMTKDNDVLYLMWTAELDGEYYRLYRTFTISTGILGDVMANTFTVGSNSAIFNVTNMKVLLDSANIKYKRMTSDIGLMQKLSSRVENGITYYYTGCYNKDFNCIVKSVDLINWIYVSAPNFENGSEFENSVYVIGDVCYYFLRQTYYYHDAILTAYDLISGVWNTPVFVSDCQSRSDFLEYDGNLYIVHAPVDRNHISIIKINKSNLNRSYEVQTARVPFYFYPYMDIYNNELYMSFCDSYKHIRLSKFTINSINSDTISEKMKTLFNI